MDETIIARVEEQRLNLEDNIAKLRSSLRHWQTIEIDYEGLKEEFLGLPDTASRDECLQAAIGFKPELVGETELKALVVASRKPSQLVDQLSKRADYVFRNIETIRKQLSIAQKQWNALVLAEDPEHREEAGLPLREITEEIDDDGNVISSNVKSPGGETSNLVDVLRKAGVTDLPADLAATNREIKVPASHDGTSDGQEVSRHTKTHIDENSISNNSKILHSNVGLPKTNDIMQPINTNDTAEEATLRQEMLHYGLGEVGAIVAELDLEDNESLLSYDGDEDMITSDNEDDYDDDLDEDLSSEESEDERGATKSLKVSDRYRRKMQLLNKKLGLENIQNLGPDPSLPENTQEQIMQPSAAEAARKAAIARDDAAKTMELSSMNTETLAKSTRKVAFAEELDIAPASIESASTSLLMKSMNENVIEHSKEQESQAVLPPMPPNRVSKFKASRSEIPTPSRPEHTSEVDRNMLIEPEGQILSTTLVERPAGKHILAPDSSDFDEELHRREVASEFVKLRNRRIHEQGGYVGGGEQDNYGDDITLPSVVDPTTGKVRKISRFKAAKLKA